MYLDRCVGLDDELSVKNDRKLRLRLFLLLPNPPKGSSVVDIISLVAGDSFGLLVFLRIPSLFFEIVVVGFTDGQR